MFLNQNKKSLLKELDSIVMDKKIIHFHNYNQSYDQPASINFIKDWKTLSLFMSLNIQELKDSTISKKHHNRWDYGRHEQNSNQIVKDFFTVYGKMEQITRHFLSICLFVGKINYEHVYAFLEDQVQNSNVDVLDDFKTLKKVIDKYKDKILILDKKRSVLLEHLDEFKYFIDYLQNHSHFSSNIDFLSQKNRFHIDINADIKHTIDSMENIIQEYSKYYKTSILNQIFNMDDLQKDRDLTYSICKRLFSKLNLVKNFDNMASFFVSNKCHDTISDNMLMVSVNVNSSIEKAIIFEDLSIAYKLKGEKDYLYFFDYVYSDKMVSDIFKANLKYIMRKNPNIQRAFISIYDKWISNRTDHLNTFSHQSIYVCIDSYFKHEGILKSKHYDLIKQMKIMYSLEQLDDEMHAIIRKHKFEQYANSIVSNKYRPLYNKTTYNSLQVLFDMNISKSILQDMIGKKLAAIKTSKELNAVIKSLIATLNSFSMDKVKLKASANNAKIISDTDNILIIEVTDFEQSKVLGSPSWCISRNSYHFDNYLSNNSRQLFVYNFNKNGKEAASMIGITLDTSYVMTAGHTKTDGMFHDKKMLEYVVEKFKSINKSLS